VRFHEKNIQRKLIVFWQASMFATYTFRAFGPFVEFQPSMFVHRKTQKEHEIAESREVFEFVDFSSKPFQQDMPSNLLAQIHMQKLPQGQVCLLPAWEFSSPIWLSGCPCKSKLI
jgi:hypothetical protein